MAATEVKRVSVDAEFTRTVIVGGISFNPAKKLIYLHEFKGPENTFYSFETRKPLHIEHVHLSGQVASTKRTQDGRTYICLARCTMKPSKPV